MIPKYNATCAYCKRCCAPTGRSQNCDACGGPLIPVLNPTRLQSVALHDLFDGVIRSLWKYGALLPVETEGVVTLHEGGTPLLRAERLGAALGVGAKQIASPLLLKDETRNPTGSFKDRQMTVSVTAAGQVGATAIAVQSSGNVGASAAAYGARAGLPCYVFAPRQAPDAKLLQARSYGATVIKVDTESPAAIFDLVRWGCEEFGWYLVSTAGVFNPLTIEGAKTIAYELFEQLDLRAPDWFISAVGGGGNLGSVWRGFKDLQQLGLIERLPKMVGVQATGCAPMVTAFRDNLTPKQCYETPWSQPIDTIATAIADDVLFDAHVALPAVRESGGLAIAVPDEETLTMQKLLAHSEGIFAEPSSCTTLAALQRLLADGTIQPDETVVCLITGSGMKDTAAAERIASAPRVIAPTREAVTKAASTEVTRS